MTRLIFQAYREAYGGLSREVWLLSLAIFINRFGTMVLPFLALYLTKDLQFSEFAAGQILSIYGLGSIAGAYMGGKLTKKVGSIRLQIVLLTLAAGMFLVLPFCKTWNSLAIGIFLQSLFAEGVRPANATAISEYSSEENLTRSYALQRMAVNLGFSFGPVIGGFLTKIDFHWLFIVDAITTFGCAVTLLLFFGFREVVSKSKLPPEKTFDDTKKDNKPGTAGDWGYYAFLGLLLPTAIVFFQFHATYPLFLRDHYKMDEVMIGCIYAVNTVMIVLFEMILVDKANKWSMILTIGWGCFLSNIGFGILPWSTALWFCVFAMVVTTIGEMLSAPISSGWVAKRSKGRDVGAYMGMYTVTWSIAAVLGPAAGTWLYEIDRNLVFHFSIVVALLSLAGFYIFARCSNPTSKSKADNK